MAENSNRSLGLRSLGKILKALGVRLLLVEDVETTARTARLMGRKRSEPQAIEGERHWRSKRKAPADPMRAAAHKEGNGTVTASELGQRGARARNAALTKAERIAAASRAAAVRWGKPAPHARSHGAGA